MIGMYAVAEAIPRIYFDYRPGPAVSSYHSRTVPPQTTAPAADGVPWEVQECTKKNGMRNDCRRGMLRGCGLDGRVQGLLKNGVGGCVRVLMSTGRG